MILFCNFGLISGKGRRTAAFVNFVRSTKHHCEQSEQHHKPKAASLLRKQKHHFIKEKHGYPASAQLQVLPHQDTVRRRTE